MFRRVKAFVNLVIGLSIWAATPLWATPGCDVLEDLAEVEFHMARLAHGLGEPVEVIRLYDWLSDIRALLDRSTHLDRPTLETAQDYTNSRLSVLATMRQSSGEAAKSVLVSERATRALTSFESAFLANECQPRVPAANLLKPEETVAAQAKQPVSARPPPKSARKLPTPPPILSRLMQSQKAMAISAISVTWILC